jgi:hypothetical protein
VAVVVAVVATDTDEGAPVAVAALVSLGEVVSEVDEEVVAECVPSSVACAPMRVFFDERRAPCSSCLAEESLGCRRE